MLASQFPKKKKKKKPQEWTIPAARHDIEDGPKRMDTDSKESQAAVVDRGPLEPQQQQQQQQTMGFSFDFELPSGGPNDHASRSRMHSTEMDLLVAASFTSQQSVEGDATLATTRRNKTNSNGNTERNRKRRERRKRTNQSRRKESESGSSLSCCSGTRSTTVGTGIGSSFHSSFEGLSLVSDHPVAPTTNNLTTTTHHNNPHAMNSAPSIPTFITPEPTSNTFFSHEIKFPRQQHQQQQYPQSQQPQRDLSSSGGQQNDAPSVLSFRSSQKGQAMVNRESMAAKNNNRQRATANHKTMDSPSHLPNSSGSNNAFSFGFHFNSLLGPSLSDSHDKNDAHKAPSSHS
uniref:Uncharacterized protein n=1 Tax=Attheya septentrionalis TaxID=420275 RepID=A0A7S2XSB1_9STRA|mmetsp:Transcript_5078/g.8915  ORF Transcript_5078/g.8915 Transcript_5078/m.8915 type:complete len:346 (+) Transcript_5078:189-1226(+)|eukprot:CAMPEP_0198289288 /NCGR_PEP_ID=MMETSP1449-20131203/7526_1 /TAXON_ID=420275 /ORGANISM="Attheya septentrionalis, Strain CCMP2084" /LENGTH=345 /DNA_ID=CAMNT_0043987593 /DNA_START=160 /DNA_END=1197 /DNA_ORIENTATION=-